MDQKVIMPTPPPALPETASSLLFPFRLWKDLCLKACTQRGEQPRVFRQGWGPAGILYRPQDGRMLSSPGQLVLRAAGGPPCVGPQESHIAPGQLLRPCPPSSRRWQIRPSAHQKEQQGGGGRKRESKARGRPIWEGLSFPKGAPAKARRSSRAFWHHTVPAHAAQLPL